MKKLTTAKIWQFAAGQFGWAMLSGIISNWLVYFYQPDQTSISQGQTVIPMLFIHGGKDRMVSPRFLDMNYNACSSIDRERLLVPDADHMESSAVDPKRYWDTVYGFIRRSFKI